MKIRNFNLIVIPFCLFTMFLSFHGYSQDQVTPFNDLETEDGTILKETITQIGNCNTNSTLFIQDLTDSKNKNTLIKEGSLSSAWDKVRQYNPDRFVYLNDGKYMMLHGYYNGNICISVYNSPELQSVIHNQKVFKSGSVVAAYNAMSNENKSDFNKKLGKLAPYFEDEENHTRLKKYLGKELYDNLLKNLNEENMHLLAGGMIHEGMHALLTDEQTYNIQEDFENNYLSMELNELRSYMAEINYHCRFCNWAKKDIDSHWNNINKLIKELEKCRRKKPPEITVEEKEKIEEIKAQIKAHIAMIRVRLREINESAKRMEFLMADYRKNYIKNIDPKKDKINSKLQLNSKFGKLEVAVATFKKDIGTYTADMEKVLSELESILDLWNVWADCKITIPPAQETTKRLITNALKIKFPDPPLKLSDDIKTAAEKEITRNYFQTGALPGESVDPGIQRFGLTTGAIFSFVNMSALNNYFDYLNKTWDGNIEHIHNSFGFDFNVSYFFTQNIGIKAGIENLNSKTEGTLEAYGSNYKSSNQTTGILAGLEFMTNPITENITLLGSACVGPYFSRYSENENGFLTEGTDNSFGYKLAGGLEFMINHSIGIQINSGYRSVKFNDFNTNFFMPGNPPVELDYSGFFGELKAIVKF